MNKIEEPLKARLTKISDDVFDGRHPNGIIEGFKTEGFVIQKPEIGKRCFVGRLRTSIVTEIINENMFKTRNSTYRIEYL